MNTNALIAGLVMLVSGVALTIAGAITKNGAMTGTGSTMIAGGLGILIPNGK